MSDYVILPKKDYVAALDQVRAKTGSLALIKSGDLANEIRSIVTSEDVHLQEVTVTPTGDDFTKYPDELYDGFTKVIVKGDPNLLPENIVEGVEIYGVEGTAVPVPEAPEYPVLVLPDEYRSYVDHCMENLYTGEFTHLMVMDFGDWIAVSFLMDDFYITAFDAYTTEFKAVGWHTCGYTKSTGEWTSHDYTTQESTGGNYAKHIVFASCPIEYGGETLFPVGVTDTIKTDSVEFDDEAGTVTVKLATGQTEVLTWVKDADGNITGVTDSQGHTTTLAGVSA